MSGHSKWSQIKRQKGVNDAKRGQTFTKLGNAITIIAKESGNGDPDSNPRLRMALEEARSVNMPKENIQRAIDRGLGKLPGQTIEEVVYEGFGPGKVAFLVSGITDNKMRTTAEIRNIFERNGGIMGNTGSTAYLFDKVGDIRVVSKGSLVEEEELEIIDLGAEEVENYQEEGIQKFIILIQSQELNAMSNKLTQAGFKVESAEIIFRPNLLTEISDQQMINTLLEFSEKLEDHDDIQKVYANFDIQENIISNTTWLN